MCAPLLFFCHIIPVIGILLGQFKVFFLLPLLEIFFVLDTALNICLSIDFCEDRIHRHQDKEDGCIDILHELVLIVGEAGAPDEVAEDSLAPMVVQEAEVTLDDL